MSYLPKSRLPAIIYYIIIIIIIIIITGIIIVTHLIVRSMVLPRAPAS